MPRNKDLENIGTSLTGNTNSFDVRVGSWWCTTIKREHLPGRITDEHHDRWRSVGRKAIIKCGFAVVALTALPVGVISCAINRSNAPDEYCSEYDYRDFDDDPIEAAYKLTGVLSDEQVIHISQGGTLEPCGYDTFMKLEFLKKEFELEQRTIPTTTTTLPS